MDTIAIFGAKYLYLLIVLIALIYFLRQPKNKQKEIFIFAIVSFPLIYLVGTLIGLLYFDPRPFVMNTITALIPHAPDNGFPSNHTLISAAFAAVIYPYNKKISWLLWAVTLAVGFSRVYVKVHHPIDVIGSITIAIIITFLCRKFFAPKLAKTNWYKKFTELP